MISDKVLARLKTAAELPDLRGTRYSVIEQIGRGGMGVVYLGEDAELGRRVAIKVLDDAREARVLAGLEHPGIVPVHDAGVLPDGRCYYAMKLVRGARLDAFLEKTAHLQDRLRIFQRICEPVAFAHARGVVHRDLKPSNIMVGEFGEVLVMDWGAPGVGTPDFMAPEQAAGEVDGRADVFALGKILEIAAGESIPKPLRSICRRATETDPAQRYQSPVELSADVAAYLDHMPVSAHRESVGERLVRFGSRNRTLLALVAAYLIMRLIVILWLGR
ncbi:MAG TPA: serine/threonine-protein kinase [Bryobacteraceae bacterium]|jgi:serine/threonine protein kinase|nr:serine/threonine-protein kinase [Bryobacteraceae bacterium]